jgi:hypothetical protein
MNHPIRLSGFCAAIAALVAVAGVTTPASDAPPASRSSTSWSAAFPVAQAEFAEHAAATD